MLYCVALTQAGCPLSPTLHAACCGQWGQMPYTCVVNCLFSMCLLIKLNFNTFISFERESSKRALDDKIILIGQLWLSLLAKFTAKMPILALPGP